MGASKSSETLLSEGPASPSACGGAPIDVRGEFGGHHAEEKRRLHALRGPGHLTGEDPEVVVQGAQEPVVSVHVQVVSRVETDSGLVEPFGVVEMAVAAKQVKVALRTRAPLHLQVARTRPEAAAAIQHDVDVVGRLDPQTRRPPAVDPRLEHVEPRGIARQRPRVERAPEDVVDGALDATLLVDTPREVLEHLQQKVLLGLLTKRQAFFA